MIKNLIGGIAVGIANVIPGVSGGTMMVILGIFNRMMEAISGVFKRENDHRMDDIFFLLQVLIGAAIGLVGFAKILEFLFNHYPIQTMYWFIGLIALSIPLFLRGEMDGEKIKWLPLIGGLAVIFALEFLNPGENEANVNPAFPTVTILLCVKMILVGMIGGATMLMPGVSGSMVLLILGDYYLFKSYLAHVTSFRLEVLIPLAFMGIGIGLGIILSAKVCDFFLKRWKAGFLSFILGLIIASSLVLIPIHTTYNVFIIMTSILAFLFGGVIVLGLGKLQ